MPEMPGVMTDILISMDDRLRLAKDWFGIILLVYIGWDWNNVCWGWMEGIC